MSGPFQNKEEGQVNLSRDFDTWKKVKTQSGEKWHIVQINGNRKTSQEPSLWEQTARRVPFLSENDAVVIRGKEMAYFSLFILAPKPLLWLAAHKPKNSQVLLFCLKK